MTSSMPEKRGKTALGGLYQQLLRRGVQYFLPSSSLEVASAAPGQNAADPAPGDSSHARVVLEWMGETYIITNPKNFTDHERRLIQSIGHFLSTRYELFFDREIAGQTLPIFGGLVQDRYISAFLDRRPFQDRHSSAAIPDRISEAVEVLRISALSSYEDKRISTGALLFGFLPDACHSLPSSPAGALPYSSDLTSIRSFHRICDGIHTLALVDGGGLMVELIDVQEWAHPFNAMELPVPTTRRYRTHCQATLCGGHICMVLTPNGEIKIFGEGVQLFSFLDGRWHLTDAVAKYEAWEAAVGQPALAARLFTAALNLAEHRRGGMFVVLDDPAYARKLVNPPDLLEHEGQQRTAKNQLHYLLRRTSATDVSAAVLESIAQIDGSVVLDRNSRLLAFGAILRYRPPADENAEMGEGGRTAASIGASQFGNVLMVSEGGQLTFYRQGHNVWTL